METIIESTNFKTSEVLNTQIEEKASSILKLEPRALYAEFNLTAIKNLFSCTLILNVPGRDIVTTSTSDDMYKSVANSIAAAKRRLRKKKMKRIAMKKNKNKTG